LTTPVIFTLEFASTDLEIPKINYVVKNEQWGDKGRRIYVDDPVNIHIANTKLKRDVNNKPSIDSAPSLPCHSRW
jgi:hypothetical protein